MNLNPAQIPYLLEADRFLGNIDEARVMHRGDRPERFATTFEVIEAFRSMRLRNS